MTVFRKILFNLSQIMNKKGVLLITASLLGIAFYAYLFYSHFGRIPTLMQNVSGYSLSIFASIIVSYIILGFNKKLDKYLSWKKYFLMRFSLSTIVAIAISILTITGISIFYFSVLRGIETNQLFIDYREEIIKLLILLFFSSIIFNTSYFGFYSYHQYAIVQISRIAQERKQLRLQFEALKSQLSPHYLFNSLNTISSLVYKDPLSAEEFIRRLALTFKYVITTDQQKLVPLREEVEFIKSYYHLLKVRFGNSLNLNINLPDEVLLTAIPPLTLQILVENAVKHNEFNLTNRLDISVGVEDNKFLHVTNNKLTPSEDVRSFRVGLENIRRRYSFYSESNIMVQNDESFSVKLPLLKAG